MTAAEKHTSGPWHSVEDEDDSFDWDSAIITTQDRFERSVVPIAKVGVDYSEPMAAEQRANARLIAAAPDLFAALVETLEIATRNEEGAFADRARAALSKAVGS